MSPKLVMPLFLTALTASVILSGAARAADPQIILAQNTQTPQQKEEERKREEQQKAQQQKAQEQQKLQQQKAQEQQKLQQQKAQEQERLQQQKAQEQQRLQQQKAAEQQLKAQEQQKLQQQKAQEQQRLQQQKAAEQQHEQQLKAQEQQKLEQPKAQEQQRLQQQKAAEQQHEQQLKAQEQQKLQQQKAADQQKLAGQQQQAAARQHTLQRQLSAQEQQAKAQREADRLQRQKLIQQQQQLAAKEKNQAAINERLRLENERLKAIREQRQQTVDRNGQTVIREPGNRTIITVNNRTFIQHDETENFRFYGGNVQTRKLANGNSVSTIVGTGGIRIEVEVDSFGRPIRRVKLLPNGVRVVLFENRPIAPGIGFALGSFVVDLPPPVIEIPREQYIVDADYASEDDIYTALDSPPVVPLDRGYSLDEILASVALRERMRSVTLDAITFDFGSADIGPDQAAMLETVGAVMRDIIQQNPGEVFLIEGHTDAVGSDIDNLSLSDRRAGAVADVLASQFGVARENLVTQGYGKQFLLIPTDGPERRNRRVVIRRITPLLQNDANQYSGNFGPGGPSQQ